MRDTSRRLNCRYVSLCRPQTLSCCCVWGQPELRSKSLYSAVKILPTLQPAGRPITVGAFPLNTKTPPMSCRHSNVIQFKMFTEKFKLCAPMSNAALCLTKLHCMQITKLKGASLSNVNRHAFWSFYIFYTIYMFYTMSGNEYCVIFKSTHIHTLWLLQSH